MFPINEFKITVVSESDTEGVFSVGPLPKGYANTVGTVFRRILLSSIPGAAITSVKLNGVQHEYTTIAGLKDDVLSVVLAMKGIALVSRSDDPVTLKLNKKGEKGKAVEVTAADLEKNPLVDVINPDYVITTLADEKAKLDVEVTVEKGIGYSLPQEEKREEVGMIPVDAIFSPIKLVAVDAKNARVGQQTDLDALEVRIVTNGTVTPSAALYEGAQILVTMAEHLLSSADVLLNDKTQQQVENANLPISEGSDDLETTSEPISVEDLKLSTRLTNALVNGGYEDLRSLQGLTEEEVSNIKGMGEKSFTELLDILKEHGITLI